MSGEKRKKKTRRRKKPNTTTAVWLDRAGRGSLSKKKRINARKKKRLDEQATR